MPTYPERAARRKDIAAFVAAGATAPAAATKFGVHRATVAAACRENNVTIPSGRKGRNGASRLAPAPATYQMIASLCVSSETLPEIAGRFGVSRQRVFEIYSACLAAGIPVRERVPGTPQKGAPS